MPNAFIEFLDTAGANKNMHSAVRLRHLASLGNFKINFYWSTVALQVSAAQQSQSAICIRVSPLFCISFPFRSSQSIEKLPVLDNRFSLVIYFIHSSVYMLIPISQFIPPSFSPWYPYIYSLYLCLYFCFANKFIWTIFLDSTYKIYYTIFVFLFLTYFTVWQSLGSSISPSLHTIHGVLKARMLRWFALPFSSGSHFVRTLHHDPSVLGGPTWHGSKFH